MQGSDIEDIEKVAFWTRDLVEEAGDLGQY
jgi:hypothetical protein